VKAMVFLGKVYEKGTLCSAKDEEKARSYMKNAYCGAEWPPLRS